MNSVPPRDGEPPPPSQAPRPLPLPTPAPPEDGEESSPGPQPSGRSRSPGHSPARKRMRLDLTGLSPSARVKRVCEHRLTRLRQVSTATRENMTELFFLSKKRNLIDMPGFRKKPSSEFVSFLKEKQAPERVISEVQTAVLGNLFKTTLVEPRRHIYSPRVTLLSPIKIGQQQDVYNARAPPLPPPSRTLPPLPPPQAPTYTMDQVQEKVRQEGWVIRRVQELSRDGLWPNNRLPKVVEQPKPLAAWDMVLQEMKWMAADFQQERLWKQSAARVQAAAVNKFVTEKNKRVEKELAELETRVTQQRTAHTLAEQVKQYWSHVATLHRYEMGKRHNLYLSNQLASQLSHVTELQETLLTTTTSSLGSSNNLSSRKRKLEASSVGGGIAKVSSSTTSDKPVITSGQHSQSVPEEVSPADSRLTPTENGSQLSSLSDDEESTIEEQEAYELSHFVVEDEIELLEADSQKELATLLRINYPGALTDYLSIQPQDEDSWSAQEETSFWQDLDTSSLDSDDDDIQPPSHKNYSLHGLLPDNSKERTSNSGGGANTGSVTASQPASDVKTNGDLSRKDLIQLSETAETHLPKSVINFSGTVQESALFKGRLREYQSVAVKWLRTMYESGLPAVLADESGLGRKVVTAAFISNLVNSLQSKGPHILIVPSSILHCWRRTFTRFTPGLRCTVLTPAMIPRSQLQDLLSSNDSTGHQPPHVLITTYRTFFQFPGVLTGNRWDLVLLAEVQNLVAAGSPEQLRALAALTSHHRMLIMTGPQKENPIDLWNVVHLLFPGVAQDHHSEATMVEGTVQYTDTVRKLHRLVSAFTMSRSRNKHPLLEKQLSPGNQVPIYVNLSSRQKKLYDDYLANPNTQEMIKSGDLSSVSSMVQHLRTICNHSSSLVDPSYTHTHHPRLPEVSPEPSRLINRLLYSSPLDKVSMDNMNLVFLKQELSTTVLTSARLRSLKASRELIQELASTSNPSNTKLFPPRVPTRKLTFTLEAITRTVNGWNVPGGWVEGMGLVRAVSGQVFKVCANQVPVPGSSGNPVDISLGSSSSAQNKETIPQHIIHTESLQSIAEINHWRCSGFPLYGQDLIRSLEITNSVRPARSRFCGQGYINCLTEMSRLCSGGSSQLVTERDDWRYRTDRLAGLLQVASTSVDQVQRSIQTLDRLELDPTFQSPKLQALCGILDERYTSKERVIIILNSAEILHIFKQFLAWKSFRSVIVCGDSSLVDQREQVDRFRLDSRFMVLVLADMHTFAGLDIPKVSTVVEYDWTPLSSDFTTRGLDWTPNTVFRLICRGTLEESTSKRSLQRRIYNELEANTETPSIKRQTLEELFRPPTDNGFFWTGDRKKKDKCKEEDEEGLSQVLSLLGLPCPDQSNTLLDLAELDAVYPDTDLDTSLEGENWEDPDLMAWLEQVPPIHRYGMKQLADCSEFWDPESWQPKQEQTKETIKLSIEKDIVRRGQKRKLEEENIEYVTYPSMLVNREWRDEEGELTYWKPPCYLEDIPDDTLTQLLYKNLPMSEEELPAVHVKKEKKHDNLLGLSNSLVSSPITSMPSSPIDKPKMKREECITSAPRSIFDRPKQFKALPRPRGLGPGGTGPPLNFLGNSTITPGQVNTSTLSNSLSVGKPVATQDSGPEWLIQEDWALHQAVLSLQQMPLNLNQVSPAHIINWDLVADIVNAVSRCYRSLRQCRSRYEATIQPREEGKILYNDITPTKKQKKTKLNIKGGQIQPAEKKPISKPMKTSMLFKQDNNNAWSTQFASRFETIKSIANKRTPTTKPVLVNSTQRNPKHASVLAEFNISYDTPLGPAQVASNRAERIQKEKLRTQQLAAVQQQTVVVSGGQQQQQQPQQQQVTTQHVVASGHQTRLGVANVPLPSAVVGNQVAVGSGNSNLPQAVVVSISQPVQQQQVQQQMSSVGQITTVNRPIVSQAIVTVSGLLPGLQQNSTLTRLAGGQIIVSQAGKGALTAGQAPVGSTLVTGRALTPAQIKVLQAQSVQKRQDHLNRQRQMQLAAGASGTGSTVTTQTVTSAIVGGVTTAATRTVPGTSGIGRGQIVRPTNFRSLSDIDLKTMIAKQQLKVTGPGIVQVQPGNLTSAQLQQLGIQVATAASVGSTGGTLVKAAPYTVQSSAAGVGTATHVSGANVVSSGGIINQQQQGKQVTIPIAAGVNLQGQQLKAVAGGRGTGVVTAPVVSGTVTANVVGGPQQQQQIQQWRQLMMRKGVQPKMALQQVGGKLPTQLILQSSQQGKGLPATVTVQQLQQIVKNVAGQGSVQIGSVSGAQGQQLLSHTILAKPGGAPGQTVQARVIPVSGTGGRGQQTIQVVAAGPHVQRTGTGVPNVTLDALSRQQGATASAIASALAAGNPVKIAASGATQQILSQVTAALAGPTGQPLSVAVRTPPIAVSSGVVNSHLTARSMNTNVGAGGHHILATASGQQPTTLVVNQPQHQISVPQHQQHQLVSSQHQQPHTLHQTTSVGNQQQILHNQVVVTNSQQQHQLISSQPQLVTTQHHQLVSSQQQLIPNHSQQQLISSQQQQQQLVSGHSVATIPQQQSTTAQIVGTGQQPQHLVVNQPQQQIVTSQHQQQQQLVTGVGPTAVSATPIHQINPNSKIQSSESS